MFSHITAMVFPMTPLLVPASLLLCAAVALAAIFARRWRAERVGAGAAARERLIRRYSLRDRRPVYFAVIEFDRFPSIRMTVGYDNSNAILAVAGKRIADALSNARLGRVGQNSVEFTFRAEGDCEARRDLLACLNALEEKTEVAGIEFRLRARVAYAPVGTARTISDSVFDSVVTALSRDSAERVRSASEFARGPSALDDLAILRLLPQAIAGNELKLHYQPKFDCRAGTVSSAEALLRWNSPSLGPVPVDQLIALAERTGAVHDITLWAIKQAALDQAELQAAGHELTLFVNLSGMLMGDDGFMREVLRLIRQAPGKIGIEITETAVIEDPCAAIKNITAFSAAGVPVSIDDFGAGLSSLAYLKQLPANELKIDREFVMGLADSHRDPLIVRAAIDLAHAMEMKVTAEGVDDPMSLSLLRVMGCDMLQGYYISRPVPLPKLIDFLESDKAHLLALEGPMAWARGRPGIVAG